MRIRIALMKRENDKYKLIMKTYLIISFLLFSLFIQTEESEAQPVQDTTQIKVNKQTQRNEVKWVNPDLKEMPGLSHHILQSQSLGHEVGYVVWTPDAYSEKARKRYPVIYFLHGAGGTESADAAGFSGLVANLITNKTLPPVICVFPNGGMSGYRGAVEKMITEELIPTIDKNYKTIAKSRSRALAGFSMGGSGSVYLSIMHPELFCAAGSMGGGFGSRSADSENKKELDASINKAIPVWKKNNFGFFMVNGDSDRPEAFEEFAKTLKKEGIDHEVLILPDTKHNLGHYYERSGNKLLQFLGRHIKE
jgi:enterochelin esterase-like enzyme